MGNGTAKLERLLPRKEAAQFLTDLGLSIAPQTLARLYSEGRGPVCMHLGRRAVYKPADLISYFRQALQVNPLASQDDPLPMTIFRTPPTIMTTKIEDRHGRRVDRAA